MGWIAIVWLALAVIQVGCFGGVGQKIPLLLVDLQPDVSQLGWEPTVNYALGVFGLLISLFVAAIYLRGQAGRKPWYERAGVMTGVVAGDLRGSQAKSATESP